MNGRCARATHQQNRVLPDPAAIAGTLIPFYFFATYAADAGGFDPVAWLQAIAMERASFGLVADLLISSLVFWPFLLREARKYETPHPAIFIALNLFVGLSCALPLFLWFRERNMGLA